MQLSAVIVDDEPLALGLLRSKLIKTGLINIVAECKNGREAIEATLNLSPDIMFLDIQMPGLDGLSVVKRLQDDAVPLIVFTTAFEQYAIDAFDVYAVDYILKPIDQERIDRSIERAIFRLSERIFRSNKSNIVGAIGAMRKHLGRADTESSTVWGVNHSQKKIVIKEKNEIILLEQSDIVWLDAAGDYVCIHSNDETYIKRSTLKELLSQLEPEWFKRVHRSTIVNLHYVVNVIPHTKGEFFLELNSDQKIKVSRNYRDVVKAFLADGI
ncbi:LytR/AlgR family response regulator transcription factor [Glaciecola sp. SC05]|uniref:LytR/AlgR family response regulator transcription factor n=1 Tax=Glaciecola sp. SC05 TaxID=1987355 RepID=UPI003527F356